MSYFEDLRKKERLVATMGLRAREKAREAGVSSFYMDPASDDVIIEEKPDGTVVRHWETDAVSASQQTRQKLGAWR